MISVRQMSRLLKRFNINNGDILALKHQSANANAEAIEAITRALTRMEINALVVVVDDFNELDVLNEVEMARRGWFKIKNISKLIKLPEKEEQQ